DRWKKPRRDYECHRDLLLLRHSPLLRLPQGPTVRLRVSLLLREQMGTLESWRKAYGALKDTTTVRLAKVNSEFKRFLLLATSANCPRSDVAYCMHALARRLSKTRNWVVSPLVICTGQYLVDFSRSEM
ncbi:hypothetical protein GW17_00015575, partial [Ensete ventricosum]